MKPPSSTLQVLTSIREELRALRGDMRGDLTALEARQTQTEVRLATEIVAVAQAVGSVRDLLRERLDDRERVDALERRVGDLERKVG